MSTNEEFAEEQFETVAETEELVQEESHSKEDKFLGIKNTVVPEEAIEEFDVEIIDDRPEADRKNRRRHNQSIFLCRKRISRVYMWICNEIRSGCLSR